MRGIDLEINKGEFTAIVVLRGIWQKTTLLNIIGGLDNPTEGEIKVNGIDLTKLSDNKLIDFRRDNIGFVFQAYNLIPVLTAYENIEFIMMLQKKSAAERDQRTRELLNAVGIRRPDR